MDGADGVRSRKRTPSPLAVGKSSGREGKSTEDAGQPLSPAARLFHHPNFNCQILATVGCGKPIDVDVVKTGLEATLLRHPRFSSLRVLDEKTGAEKWVRTKVLVDAHVVVPALDPKMEFPDQYLEDYVSNLTNASLDMSKPLWEIHILNLKSSEAAATAVLRIHHSLGDGVSLMSLILACTRKTSDPNSPPTVPERRPAAWKRSVPVPVLGILWAVIRLLWHTFLNVVVFMLTATFLKDTRTPLMGSEGVEHRPKRVVHRTLSLDDMKAIKNATNTTINDVLLGIAAAGLSRYLRRQYGKDKATTDGQHSLPADIRLRAAVLVNIRSTAKIEALSDLMEGAKTDIEWGNKLGYVIVPFIINWPEDPLDHIRWAKEIADKKKHSLEAVFTYWSGCLIVKCFGIKAGAALCQRMLKNTTLSFSNVVGPKEEISFYGHPLVYLAPTVCGHPHALTIHFQSYMNKMTMVVAADENAIPDPHQLLDDAADCLKIIKDAAEFKARQ